jgi:RNA-directed DNA polymerase
MKRASRLFDEILGRDNLRQAFYRAARGKRDRIEVRSFAVNLDRNLMELSEALRAETFRVGRAHQFVIYDPKIRTITAPIFPERVVHHAIMNVCEPWMDRFLIADTFACRLGKGRIAALGRARYFCKRFPYAIKLDMRRYFPSISHDILLARLRRRFKDARLITLFEKIVRRHEEPGNPSRGLPIGSLTSQHFANFFLGWFDRFVKEVLRIPGYLRYMDDCVIWGNTKKGLAVTAQKCEAYLVEELDLSPKPPEFADARRGLEFLGCRVFADRLQLGRRSRRRYRMSIRRLGQLLEAGAISEGEAARRADSLTASRSCAQM